MTLSLEDSIRLLAVVYASSIGAISAVATLWVTKHYDKENQEARMKHERKTIVIQQLINKKIEKGEAMLYHISNARISLFSHFRWTSNSDSIKKKIDEGISVDEKELNALIQLYCEKLGKDYTEEVSNWNQNRQQIFDGLMNYARVEYSAIMDELASTQEKTSGWSLYFNKEDPSINLDADKIFIRYSELPKMIFDDGTKIDMMNASTKQIEQCSQEYRNKIMSLSDKIRTIIDRTTEDS